MFDNCLAWTDCYGYKIGQGVWERQDNVTFQNSVVYTAGVGIGIDHKFGSNTASNITFENIDIEGLHGNSGGQATWLSVLVELSGQGVGPVEGLFVKNIRARTQGSRNGFLQGYNSSSMVSGVTISDVYMVSPPVLLFSTSELSDKKDSSWMVAEFDHLHFVERESITDSAYVQYANITPATTLQQMNLLSTNFSEGIKIINS